MPNLKPIAGYRVQSCPRYHDAAEEVRVGENFLAQSTFWSAVRFLLIGQTGISVELRFVSNSTNRSTEIYILVYSRGTSYPASVIESLERLLPIDYSWIRIPTEQINPIVDASFLSSELSAAPKWYVAKLIRRIEFIDLPTNQPWILGGSTPQAQDSNFRSDRKSPEISSRKIPDIFRSVWSQFKTDTLCLPFINGMSDQSADRHRLCLELQYSAPVVLSISLHPVEDEALEEDRQAATHLRQCLDPFAEAMANTGFAQLRAMYDRYSLPLNYLCNIVVRVAAVESAKAVGVAHSMAAQLGGMTAFEVYSSPDFKNTLENIASPDGDLPPFGAFSENPSAWNAKLRQRVERINVGYNEELFGFLIRMPHLFVLNEMDCIFRLPYASEKGLPGIKTEMVPPFYSSGSQFVPFNAPAPENAVRIGVARTSAVIADANNDSRVGFSTSDIQSGQWHCVKSKDLTKHALIVGSTGSGKSVTTQFFLRELKRLNVPFLVIEPVKTEYAQRLTDNGVDVKQVNLEGTTSGQRTPNFLSFDPMRLQDGVTVARHISYLKSCFLAAFPLDEVLALVLENGIRAYYTTSVAGGGCGLKLFEEVSKKCWTGQYLFPPKRDGKAVYPSFATFKDFFIEKFIPHDLNIEKLRSSGTASNSLLQRAEEWQQLFKRRFANLMDGPLGEAFRAADEEFIQTGNSDHMGNLLCENTVLELDAIPDNDDKALVMAFLMTFLYERRQVEDASRRKREEKEYKDIRHVLVIEEAHRLLSNQSAAGRSRGETAGSDSKQKAVSLFVDMLAEIRAYGQGITIVEQIPTKIVPETVKNTNLKVMLRLTSKEDREFLGDAMNFTDAQKHFVNNLKTGQFVIFEEGVDQPVLVSLPAESLWDTISW